MDEAAKTKQKTGIPAILLQALLVLLALWVILIYDLGFDTDTIWHYLMGRDILAGKAFFDNAYSWLSGTAWNQQEWLFDVLIFLVLRTLKTFGFLLLSVAAKLCWLYLAIKLSGKQIRSWLGLLFTAAALCLLLPRPYLGRPMQYSGFVFLWLLVVYPKRFCRMLLFVHFAIGCVLANFHAGIFVVFGGFYLTLFVSESLVLFFVGEKRKGLSVLWEKGMLFTAFFCGGVINPSGVSLFFTMLTATRLKSSAYIQEWGPMGFGNPLVAVVLILLCMLLGMGLFLSKKREERIRIYGLLVLMALMLVSRKSAPLFLLCFVVFGYPVVENMIVLVQKKAKRVRNRKKERQSLPSALSKPAIGILIAFSVLSILVPYSHTYPDFSALVRAARKGVLPDEMADTLKREQPKRLLHGYVTGNFLMEMGIPVWVDTRQHPYAAEFGMARSMDDMWLLSGTKNREVAEEILDRYDPDYVLTSKELCIDWYLITREDYEIVLQLEKGCLYRKVTP